MPTLVRLAAGEWKIQLAALVNQDDDDDDNNDSAPPPSSPSQGGSNNSDEERIVLVEVCAQYLIWTVNYLGQLSDRVDDNDRDDPRASCSNFLPSGDVLEHVRQSLVEALTTAVQYLGWKTDRRVDDRRDQGRVNCAVVRLLAKLLTEFDVFLPATAARERTTHHGGRPSSIRRPENCDDDDDNDDGAREGAVLHALRVAMEIATSRNQNSNTADGDEAFGADSINCLLPSVAAVLASAEGDPSRGALLQEYGLLGSDSVVAQLLLGFWTNAAATSDTTSVSWACEVTELWLSMDRIVSDTSGMQTAIVQYLQRQLKAKSSSSQASEHAMVEDALSAAVGCYITLRGNSEPPGEPDATILQQTLAFCERHGYDAK